MREVSLISYLPSFIANFKEIAATLEVEKFELVGAWEAVDGVLKNVYIEMADECGISRFEKMIGILPSEKIL